MVPTISPCSLTVEGAFCAAPGVLDVAAALTGGVAATGVLAGAVWVDGVDGVAQPARIKAVQSVVKRNKMIPFLIDF